MKCKQEPAKVYNHIADTITFKNKNRMLLCNYVILT